MEENPELKKIVDVLSLYKDTHYPEYKKIRNGIRITLIPIDEEDDNTTDEKILEITTEYVKFKVNYTAQIVKL